MGAETMSARRIGARRLGARSYFFLENNVPFFAPFLTDFTPFLEAMLPFDDLESATLNNLIHHKPKAYQNSRNFRLRRWKMEEIWLHGLQKFSEFSLPAQKMEEI